jgi:hypothetical protein
MDKYVGYYASPHPALRLYRYTRPAWTERVWMAFWYGMRWRDLDHG